MYFYGGGICFDSVASRLTGFVLHYIWQPLTVSHCSNESYHLPTEITADGMMRSWDLRRGHKYNTTTLYDITQVHATAQWVYCDFLYDLCVSSLLDNRLVNTVLAQMSHKERDRTSVKGRFPLHHSVHGIGCANWPSSTAFCAHLTSVDRTLLSTSVCPSVRLLVKRVHPDKTK